MRLELRVDSAFFIYTIFNIRILFFRPRLNILNFYADIRLQIFVNIPRLQRLPVCCRMYLVSGWYKSNFGASLRLVLLKTHNFVVFTNFQHKNFYSFQNLSLGFILKIFL